jgi:hypothetical protein
VSHIRRGFLIGGFSTLVAVVLYKWPQSDPIDVLSKRLRALFPEIVAAAPILRGISELAPLRGDRTALADSIFSPDLVTAVNSTVPETMDFLVRAVDRDFADGRLVVIKGWTLSQTEARLLAFIAADGT